MQLYQPSLDLRISFFLRRARFNADGKNPIILRIKFRGEQKDITTGVTIHPAYWIKGVGRIDMAEPEAAVLNRHLEDIAHRAREHYDELKYSRIEFSIDDLADKIRGKNPPPETLIDYVDEKITEYKQRVGVDLAMPTYYKYQRVKNYLIEFLESTRRLKNIPVSRVDNSFLQQFFLYLRKDKNNSNNSAVTLMNFLKTVLRKPMNRGQIKEDPFEGLKMRFQQVDRGFLTKEEIDRIAECELEFDYFRKCRDQFVFCCYTGLAYMDLKQFSGKHIIKDPDGSFYIKKARQKTQVISIIPILPPAERILKKYSPTDDIRHFNWFVPVNQKMNEYLQTIREAARIERKLHMHLARHTFATTVTLANKVPLESVSKMLGHSGIKHTLRYARVVGEKIKTDMEHVRGIFK